MINDRRNVDTLLEDIRRDLGEACGEENKGRFERIKKVYQDFKKNALRSYTAAREVKRSDMDALVIEDEGKVEMFYNDFHGACRWTLTISSYTASLQDSMILGQADKSFRKQLGKPDMIHRDAVTWRVDYPGKLNSSVVVGESEQNPDERLKKMAAVFDQIRRTEVGGIIYGKETTYEKKGPEEKITFARGIYRQESYLELARSKNGVDGPGWYLTLDGDGRLSKTAAYVACYDRIVKALGGIDGPDYPGGSIYWYTPSKNQR